MPRQKRKQSETGIYHVMLRGINRKTIFVADEDNKRFIQAVNRAKRNGNFLLYAYCLMGNHVHLLIKENEKIGKSIKRIAVSFVQWYNKKYDRYGHLFQNRFKSEAVEDDTYLLVVLRYIHQNPVKAGICKLPVEYEWSSYQKYIKRYNGKQVNIDAGFIDDYFVDRESFELFMQEVNNDNCLEYKCKKRLSDQELRERIIKEFEVGGLANVSKTDRDKMIFAIKKETDASIRQLSRVLGIGRGVVARAVKKR
ncbi:transposase [Halocella sp. SP3-1]|uniref:transposase n=1 Tax=Halocella sp. SP3-1 TaxID=2382161 RepID=UPI000F753ABC|nr:transposase [Halocella sp. SP3-1]AZO93407.1 transposase [Halocella sp. SP3-1]MTI59935.1 transposase [Bacillota bacterium]